MDITEWVKGRGGGVCKKLLFKDKETKTCRQCTRGNSTSSHPRLSLSLTLPRSRTNSSERSQQTKAPTHTHISLTLGQTMERVPSVRCIGDINTERKQPNAALNSIQFCPILSHLVVHTLQYCTIH
jgi:hypothetical protein